MHHHHLVGSPFLTESEDLIVCDNLRDFGLLNFNCLRQELLS